MLAVSKNLNENSGGGKRNGEIDSSFLSFGKPKQKQQKPKKTKKIKVSWIIFRNAIEMTIGHDKYYLN